MKPSERMRLYWLLKKKLEDEYLQPREDGRPNKSADYVSYMFLDKLYEMTEQNYVEGAREPFEPGERKEIFEEDYYRTNELAHWRVAKQLKIGEIEL
jgi:hypothetical protein